jgi:thioredoxin reductase
MTKNMTREKFDAIIIGGSYSGLAAGMGLGRAIRSVLIIDSGLPANRYAPHSHNFLTHDGKNPTEILTIAKRQVSEYKTIKWIDGLVVNAERSGKEFIVLLADGSNFRGSKLILATGIIDVLPSISGLKECWGKSVLHCPYCHGYEIQNTPTGILGNGDYAYEFGSLISNWTSKLTIYTNGPSTLSSELTSKLRSHNIKIVEDRIEFLKHIDGYLQEIIFTNARSEIVKAIYTRPILKQSSDFAQSLGYELTDEGYIKTDALHHTTVPGIYACGDNVTRMRTVANAVAMGTTTAITLNKELILEQFLK